jgi:ATP-dependent RNA helicase RhlE
VGLYYTSIKDKGTPYMSETTETPKKYYDPISMAKRTTQLVFSVDQHDKANLLTLLLKDNAKTQTVIITKSKKGADALSLLLEEQDINVRSVHGNHRKALQDEVAKAFNDKELDLLITTDAVLQQLALNNIERIINFDIPLQLENYIAGLKIVDEIGELLSLMSPDEVVALTNIEVLLKIEIAEGTLEGFESTPAPRPTLADIKDKKKKPRHKKSKAKKTKKKDEEA